LLEGLQGFPTLKQIVSLNIGLKRIISDYNQGHNTGVAYPGLEYLTKQ
jgi:hypothetical protein